MSFALRRYALLFTLFLAAAAPAQNNSIGDDFNFAIDKGKEIVSFPFKSTLKFFTTVGVTAAATGALFLADESVRKLAAKNRSSINSSLFSVDKYYGNAYTVMLSAAIYTGGLVSGSEKIRKAGLNSAVSIIYAGIITQSLKMIIGRHRPYKNDGSASFSPFATDNDFFSLPSGHTTVAFAFSTAMAEAFDNTYWSVFWYSIAGLTAASRIYNDQHWLSDTFLGAAIGYGIGKLVSRGKENSDFSLSVSGYGIGINYSLD